MARPLRIEYPGAFYHVTSRGNEQKDIFKSKADRKKFLTYLESAVARYGGVIHAWCLMNNHYHLLLETPSGNLSQIMRHINGAYTSYFNTKRKRAGHLFQGRYKAILVEADEYATELSRYIHLNPVRVGLVARPEDYLWSSYRDYVGQSKVPDWLTTQFVLEYFGGNTTKGKDAYRNFVESLTDAQYESPLNDTVASTVLGRPEFVNGVAETKIATIDRRNIPAVKKLTLRPTLDEIVIKIETEFGQEKLARKLSIYGCRQYSGAKLKEIGIHFGLSDAAISQICRRLVLKAESDPDLRRTLERVKEILETDRS